MAGNAGGFGDDPESYSHLLFGDGEISGLETGGCFGFSVPSFSPDDANKMLCFGDYDVQSNVKPEVKSGPACNDDHPLPVTSVSKKKRKGPGSHSGAPAGTRRNSKKQNSEEVNGHAKGVRKEKLGGRITALQQLVSPFGKTDTASVLHEALGYIGFLQDQVQVLCSPYLASCPSSSVEPLSRNPVDVGGDQGKKRRNDLRSRGLCLVPMELTLHVADSNGADLWTSGAMIE